MKILVLSDLHLDLWGGSTVGTNLKTCKPDVVVLAGDIHCGARAVTWAANEFPKIPVYYVMGNHEAYNYNLQGVEGAIDVLSRDFPYVQPLNCATFNHDGVRFIGATLWSDFKSNGEHLQLLSMSHAKKCIHDYHTIAFEDRRLTPSDTLDLHNKHLAYIKGELAKPFDGKTVVVTHFLPSRQSVSERYKGDFLNAYFASDLDHLVVKANVWIHGHTHDSKDYFLGDCNVVCNPRGYGVPPENPFFNPNFIVEI